ncbi:MAG: Cna B-type domain-containing protein, partial [Oscillospiraceae bacterium]|nr:Cna B-type domain-containing protein [Oscillospiraceae bacterium]
EDTATQTTSADDSSSGSDNAVSEENTDAEAEDEDEDEDTDDSLSVEITDETQSASISSVGATAATASLDEDDGISLTAGSGGGSGSGGSGSGGSSSSSGLYYHIDLRVTGTFTVTVSNTVTGETDVTVNKVWSDGNENHSNETITVYMVDSEGNHVTVDGSEISATLSASNNWSYTWEDISLTDGTYYVTDTVEGYTADSTKLVVDSDGSDTETETTTATYTGSITVQSIKSLTIYKDGDMTTTGTTVSMSSSVTKDGNDYEIQSTVGHGGQSNALDLEDGDVIVVVVVYTYTYSYIDANGETQTVNSEDSVEGTFTVTVDEDANKCDGQSGQDNYGYDFTISAESLLEDSKVIVDEKTVTVTNTPVSTVDIPVTKVWDDNDDQYGLRPSEVTVTLYENGTVTEQTLTLNDDNSWTDTFKDLPEKDADGNTISYTVVESAVSNYTSSTEVDSETGAYTFTNKLDMVTIKVTKQVTGNMGDTTKDFDFTLTLANGTTSYTGTLAISRADGEATELTATDSNYSFSLSDDESITITVPAGHTYTVEEESYKSDGYTTTVSGTASGTTTSGSNVEITVTNDKTVTPDTGITLSTLPFVLILTASLSGLGLVVINRKRRDSDG